MSVDNPYESPTSSTQESPAIEPGTLPTSTDNTKIVRYAQLGLRLLGVMFVIDGISVFTFSLTSGLMQTVEFQQLGYSPTPDAYVCGWAAQAAAYVIFGLYLILGGRWVVEKVFLPPSPPEA